MNRRLTSAKFWRKLRTAWKRCAALPWAMATSRQRSSNSRRKREHEPMLSEDILFLPVTELSRRIRLRKLSPVELTESYLERSGKIGARLNAYATLTPDLALEQAHAAEKD